MASLYYRSKDECSLENNILFNIDFENFIQYNFDLRELVVTNLLNEGYSIKEIAKHQNCSRRYITRVVKNLRNKLYSFLQKGGYNG